MDPSVKRLHMYPYSLRTPKNIPQLTRSMTIASWPSLAASINGEYPSSFTSSKEAPFSINKFASCRCPPQAVKVRGTRKSLSAY